jgi:hypothetical protein
MTSLWIGWLPKKAVAAFRAVLIWIVIHENRSNYLLCRISGR